MPVARSTDQTRSRQRGLLILGCSVAFLFVTMIAAIWIGAVGLSPTDVIHVIARRLGFGDFGVTLKQDQIVWQMRLPRALTAAATGAGLAIAGVVLQSLTRNDLADPYLLGISSGAMVGAVLVLVLGVSVAGLASSAMLSVGAFLGALIALALVLLLATDRAGALPPARTILAGVAVAHICSAYTSFIVMSNEDGSAARRVLNWTLGSLAGADWPSTVLLVTVSLLGVIVVLAYSSALDSFAFGESAASSLGGDVRRTRWTLMLVVALVVAVLVAYTGAIGFVGLIVPHVARMFVGPRHARLLPVSALLGAALLVWADTLARSAIPGREIPIGVVTAGIGAPMFAYLLHRSRRVHEVTT